MTDQEKKLVQNELLYIHAVLKDKRMSLERRVVEKREDLDKASRHIDNRGQGCRFAMSMVEDVQTASTQLGVFAECERLLEVRLKKHGLTVED